LFARLQAIAASAFHPFGVSPAEDTDQPPTGAKKSFDLSSNPQIHLSIPSTISNLKSQIVRYANSQQLARSNQ